MINFHSIVQEFTFKAATTTTMNHILIECDSTIYSKFGNILILDCCGIQPLIEMGGFQKKWSKICFTWKKRVYGLEKRKCRKISDSTKIERRKYCCLKLELDQKRKGNNEIMREKWERTRDTTSIQMELKCLSILKCWSDECMNRWLEQQHVLTNAISEIWHRKLKIFVYR